MTQIFNYKCLDCGHKTESILGKIDAVCSKCKSLNMDYARDKEGKVIAKNILDKIDEERGLKVSFAADTMETIANTDLVQLSRKLLDSLVVASGALNIEELDANKIRELHLVLGFLNATNNVVKNRLEYFKMTNTADKLKAIKGASQNL